MKTCISCPDCGREIELEPTTNRYSQFTPSKSTVYFHTVILCVAGWVLFDSDHLLWGCVYFAAVLAMPLLHEVSARYQQKLPSVIRERKRRENERLLEIARSDKSNSMN